MIRTMELTADAEGSLQLPQGLRLAPGARAILVLDHPDKPTFARPGHRLNWVLRISPDFDDPLPNSFWTGPTSE